MVEQFEQQLRVLLHVLHSMKSDEQSAPEAYTTHFARVAE